jgi:DNA-binding LacI/PurR family transcriptional regulator
MLDRDENSRVRYNWLGGYLAAQNTADGRALAPLLTTGADTRAAVKAWLRRTRPDAVIGFGPRQFLALEQAGRRIPRDLAFAALDVEQTRLDHVEEVTGINQNLPLIGATAIDILASQLYHNEQGLPQRPVYSMIEGFWVPGRTAPARSDAAAARVTRP